MSTGKEASFIMRLIDMVSGPAKAIAGAAGAATGKLLGMGGAVSGVAGKAFAFNQISQAIQGVGQELNAAVAPGVAFDSALAEMQSVTGLSGQALADLGEKARAQALVFGGDAAASLGSYNELINRLGPDIATNSTALGAMGNDVLLLSKLMRGDAAGASNALSTSLLQFGVDLRDPQLAARKMTEYMNTMVAGMNQGSMDVPKVSAALEQAGSTARKAGLSFAETNAAIQTIAKSGRMGSEAGVGLRNVLAKLGGTDILPKEVVAKLKALHVNMNLVNDSSQPLSVRLKELKKIQGDATLTAQMFGLENKVVADTLLDNIGYYDKLLPKLNDGNAAANAARPIMESYAERMGRAGARVRDWGISLFNATRPVLPFVQGGIQALDTASRLGPALDVARGALGGLAGAFRVAEDGTKGLGLQLLASGWGALQTAARFVFTAGVGLGSFIASLVTATAAQLGLNVVMLANPVGLFIVALLAVGAAVALVIHYWDDLKKYLLDFGKLMWEESPFGFLTTLIDVVFPGFKQAVADTFGEVLAWAERLWKKLTGLFSGLKNFGKNLLGGAVTVPADPYAALGPPPGDKDRNKPGGSASGALGQQNKGTDVQGDASKARIVSTRIDKIEVIVKLAGAAQHNLQDLGRQVAGVIVGSVRDSEIILSNG